MECKARHMMYSDFQSSDMGQVWGWGYGGEGQLGLGSRIRMVSSPHPVPCIKSSSYGIMNSEEHSFRVPGSYVKGIACGGRHSAVITGTDFKLLLQISLKHAHPSWMIYLVSF